MLPGAALTGPVCQMGTQPQWVTVGQGLMLLLLAARSANKSLSLPPVCMPALEEKILNARTIGTFR